MNNLEILKMSEKEDCEAVLPEENLQLNTQKNEKASKKNKKFKDNYFDFYDDIKRVDKHIKEDW